MDVIECTQKSGERFVFAQRNIFQNVSFGNVIILLRGDVC